MSAQDKIFLEPGKFFREDVLKETRKVYTGMLLASKNLSLYPSGHSIPVKSIKQFHETLQAYLEKYGYLRLEIERNRIVSLDEEISSGSHEEGTLPFTLFRDGIRWIEFTQGINLEEIRSFLTIVNQHMILSAEPEGDIVTNIWEAQFSHIQYDVADFFVNIDGEVKDSISSFKAEPDSTEPREENLGETHYIRQSEIDPLQLVLSKQEQEQLQEMIRFEEEADFSSYVNALLDILLLYRDEESFRTILEVLSEEFTGTLAREEFDISLKIVWGLRKIVEQYRKEMSWAVPIADNFFQKASDVDSFHLLRRHGTISTRNKRTFLNKFSNILIRKPFVHWPFCLLTAHLKNKDRFCPMRSSLSPVRICNRWKICWIIQTKNLWKI